MKKSTFKQYIYIRIIVYMFERIPYESYELLSFLPYECTFVYFTVILCLPIRASGSMNIAAHHFISGRQYLPW